MKTLYAFLIFLLTVSLMTACARSDLGTLVRDDEVKQYFETATILPGLTYYYTGPEAKPDAIMALNNSFTLANERNFWIKVDISEKMLQDWNRMINNQYRIKFPYYGSIIMTPDGRNAGSWYSNYENTVIKTPDPQSIIIYTPVLRNERHPFLERF